MVLGRDDAKLIELKLVRGAFLGLVHGRDERGRRHRRLLRRGGQLATRIEDFLATALVCDGAAGAKLFSRLVDDRRLLMQG
jgi:hypothetical protein